MTTDPDARIEARIETMIAAYGGDLERWPAEERARVSSYLAGRPELRVRLEEAVQLDALLDRVPVPVASADLRARVLATSPAHRQAGDWRAAVAGLLRAVWPEARAWQPAGVFLASAALGVVLGLSVVSPLRYEGGSRASSDGEDLVAAIFPSLDNTVDWQ